MHWFLYTSASLSIKYKNNKLGLIPFISYYETVVLEFAKLVFAKLVHIQSTQFMIIKKQKNKATQLLFGSLLRKGTWKMHAHAFFYTAPFPFSSITQTRNRHPCTSMMGEIIFCSNVTITLLSLIQYRFYSFYFYFIAIL